MVDKVWDNGRVLSCSRKKFNSGVGSSVIYDPLYQSSFQSLPGIKTNVNNRDFRARIRQAVQAGDSFTFDGYQLGTSIPGTAVLVYSSKPPGTTTYTEIASGFEGFHWSPISHLSSSFTEAENKALTSIHKKIRAEMTHMSGPTFLGELREAIRMIRRPADALSRGLNDYLTLLGKRKKGIVGRTQKTRRKIFQDIAAGTWLEASFGWRPLFSDIKGLAETAARLIHADTHRARIRSYFEVPTSSDTKQETAFGGGNTMRILRYEVKVTTCGVQYIVGLKTDTYGPVKSLDRLRELSGFTLENFVPTLYELMPWSFLADYFFNIGDVIEAACTNTSGVRWIVRTTRQVTECRRSVRPLNLAADMDSSGYLLRECSGSLGTTTVYRKRVVRTIPSTLGIPSLSFSLPGDTYRAANMLALMKRRHQVMIAF